MMEPVKLMAPMMLVRTLVTARSIGSAEMPGSSLRNSAVATIAAAPPPAPLKMATICGIAVIFTERAK